MDWFKYLKNEEEIRNIFPDGLSLDDLRLLKIEYLPGNIAKFNLYSGNPPPSLPRKWLLENPAGLSLIFDVGIKRVRFFVEKEFFSMPSLTVEVSSDQIKITSNPSGILMDAAVFFIKLKVAPLQSLDF